MEPKCNFVQQDQKQQYFISTKLKNNVKVSKSEQILKYQIYICKQIQKFKTRLSIFNNTYNSIQQFNRWVLVDKSTSTDEKFFCSLADALKNIY